jgi:hypothetical protein
MAWYTCGLWVLSVVRERCELPPRPKIVLGRVVFFGIELWHDEGCLWIHSRRVLIYQPAEERETLSWSGRCYPDPLVVVRAFSDRSLIGRGRGRPDSVLGGVAPRLARAICCIVLDQRSDCIRIARKD